MKKLLVLLCIALAVPVPAQTPAKYALVIGNAAYTGLKPLANPVNDANSMAAALQSLGFTVDKLLDANLSQMESAVVRLRGRLEAAKNSYGFVFYAGHGVQSGAVNYLIPVGANIPAENALRERAVSLQFMLAELNDAGNALNVVVLDACRDNPFSWGRGRGTERGLSVVGQQPADSIIVYATSAGSTAADGAGWNSPFTKELLANIKTPGLEITEVFRRTGAAVSLASGRKQIPAVYNQFFGMAYLAGLPAAPAQPAARVERPVPANFVLVEGGTFQMGSNDGRDDEKPVHSVTVTSFFMGKYEVTQKEWAELMGNNPSSFNGDNHPVETVSWNDAVEYCNRRSVREGLTPAYTVSGDNVTWNRNVNGYRLPTEAEWEFAAKGGIKGGAEYTYSGSNNIDAVAWYDGNSGGGGRTTHDVGTKVPNSLGIYDMSGNVSEWCWDKKGRYAFVEQTNPAGSFPLPASDRPERVTRGGDWINPAGNARSTSRLTIFPNSGLMMLGFRLVRSAP